MAELARRLLATARGRVALALLLALAALSVYAPFLANDRPYRLVAIDRGAYERARAELVPLAASCARLAPGTGAAREQLELEVAALRARLAVLRRYLRAQDQVPLEPLDAALDGLRRRRVPAAASALVDAARLAVQGLAPAAAGDATSGVQLVPAPSYPLVSALAPLDVALAALAPCAALAWLLRRRTGARWALALACGLPALAGLAHAAVAIDPGQFAPGAVGRGIAAGTIEVRSVTWPPLAMGYGSANLGEAWRPPTWLASSALDEDGRYLRGPRAAQPPAGRPVVRPGEPALNSALRHVLGTDALGRDVLARCLWGGRVSLAVGLVAALLLSAIGTLLGAAAGYLGGAFDFAVSRTVEVVLCFPAFFLVLCAIAWVDPAVVPTPVAVVGVIAAVGWTGTARLVRAEALRVAALEHVLAARALGLRRTRVLFAHVLPNALGPALVAFAFAAGGAIVVEASLAYLGLGVQEPVPSWGALVGAARSADHAWLWIAPGLLVFLAVLGWILLAEALREALDPRGVRP